MVRKTTPGPFRKIFLRREGLLGYISPGLLIISFISIVKLGVTGIVVLLIAGFIQDWANNEEFFSWINTLLQNSNESGSKLN